MKRKVAVLFALSMLAFAGTAGALQTDDLIAITAMPLAVADVVALPDVPQDEVMSVVTTLNRAVVPAPQFVEIVRYVPVALVQPAEPRFTTYVTQEYDRGIVGEPLALAIADRYDTYGIDDVAIQNPPVVTYVERREILPQAVVTRFQPTQFDPVALVAMPLAVAAVADLVNVPRNDLMQFVASLNQAMVPAPQFVEVVRYSPVVLVDRTESPQFIRFVSTEVDRGIIGRPLAYAIANRIETFEPVDIDVVAPRPRLLVDRSDDILPPVVVTRTARTRVASVDRDRDRVTVDRTHPHGGPPGQLKKERGLQTGAEVVHGSRPNRVARTRVADHDDNDNDHRQRRARVTKEKRKAAPRAVRNDDAGEHHVRQPKQERQQMREQRRPERMHVSQNHRGGHGNGHGNGKGKGKGKG